MKKKGILITGTHRSGSTWVGKVLGRSNELGYIQEPFSPGCRPGICHLPIENWFQYVGEFNGGSFEAEIERVLRFQYDIRSEIVACKSLKDILRMGRDLARTSSNRARKVRPLIKDPIAFFSTEWLSRSFDLDVIILIRHPAAFVSSLKRLNWCFDFDDLLIQRELMAGLLCPYKSEIEKVKSDGSDLIVQGALFWKIVYDIANTWSKTYKNWTFVKHEDLCLRPSEEFCALCAKCEIEFSNNMRSFLAESTNEINPTEPPDGTIHYLKRSSVDMLNNWKTRLTAAEIETIRLITDTVSSKFYSDSEWD